MFIALLSCASCSSSYISKTGRHFIIRIEKHNKSDIKLHILTHLHSTAACIVSYYSPSFKIIDKANLNST